MRKNWYFGAAGIIIVLVLLIVGIKVYNPTSANGGQIEITAVKQQTNGVELDSSFRISSKQPLSKDMIKSHLTTTPEIKYQLKKDGSDKVFVLIPDEPLANNTVYRFAFVDNGRDDEQYSWAFQTTEEFHLVSTLPRNETVGVPTNTGIEITFSNDSFSLDDAGKYINISPRVDGRYEKHKKTLVFVPKTLKPGTLYTITIHKGLPANDSNQTLSEEKVIRFETSSTPIVDQRFVYFIDNQVTEFNPRQIPTFPVNISTGAATQKPFIEVYRYADADEYGQAWQRYNKVPNWCTYTQDNWLQNTEKMTRVAGYESEFKPAGNYQFTVSLAQTLPAGCYLMQIKAGDITRQAMFQVSDLAVYRVQSGEQWLFWANDIELKKPAPDIELWVNKKKTSINGNAQGVVWTDALLKNNAPHYVVLKSGVKELVVPLQESNVYDQESSVRQSYWKYLYLDRELYLPGDAVHYWGVLSSRDGKTVSDKITLELWGGDYYCSEDRSAEPLLTRQLKVQNDTYSGQVRLPMLKPGYYYLEVKLGKVSLLSRGFSVDTYQKPAYKITITPEKKAVIAGDNIKYGISTSFFEGTVVPDIKLSYNADDKQGQVTTNGKGEASVTYKAEYAPDNFAPYIYQYFNAAATLPETGEISDYNGTLVFPANIVVRGEVEHKNNEFTVKAKLNRIDLSEVDKGGYVSEDNYIKSPVANGLIQGKLYKEVWTRIQIGESYDYINKQVIPQYNYSFNTELAGTFTMTTDTQGNAQYQGKLDKGFSYYLDLTSPDEKGRLGRTRCYISQFYDANDQNDYYSLKTENNEYQIGQKVQVNLLKNEQPVTIPGQSVLFFQGQTSLEKYQAGSRNSYELTFKAADIPNTNVFGVIFDGEGYQEAGSCSVSFARDKRKLQINLLPDKTEYRPGETVKLKVQVKTNDGQAVKDARVNLNLVDEALYRLMDQQVDLLGSLYGEYLSPSIYSWKSHYHPNLNFGGAEQGGEGGGERKDFRDTVLFTELVTNSRGEAETSFKLPDNLTSWRVTYHAVNSELYAGSGTYQLPVRLPFFIDMVLGSSYRTGDQPVVGLRSYGSKLLPSKSVQYQMTLKNDKGDKQSFKTSGTSFVTVDWQLPVLQKGRYTVKVIANSGKYKDILVRTFSVNDNIIQREIVSQSKAEPGMKINGSAIYPTTLIFSDYEKGQYLKELFQLSMLESGRVEHQVASLEAKKLIQRYFPVQKTHMTLAEKSSLLKYQQSDGGISILPYASSDLKVSVQVAGSAPGLFDQRALAGYFYRLLDNDKKVDKSQVLLGLASLNEPVLLQVKQELKRDKLSPEEKINLNLAVLQLGDGAEAVKVYRELLGKYGQDVGSALRINVGSDQDDILNATTEMALLSARLNQAEKQELLAYLAQNTGEETVNSLELIQIMNSNLKYMDAKPVSFSYELNGKVVKRNLGENDSYKLTLLPKDLTALKIKSVQGKVGVVSNYTEPMLKTTGINDGLTIKRNYYVDNKLTNSWSRNDLVRVEINTSTGVKSPDGTYELVDVLPAGLAYVNKPYFPGLDKNTYSDWPTEVNGRQLTFMIEKGRDRIVYYARVTNSGKFRAEAPLLQHCQYQKVYVRGDEQLVNTK